MKARLMTKFRQTMVKYCPGYSLLEVFYEAFTTQ